MAAAAVGSSHRGPAGLRGGGCGSVGGFYELGALAGFFAAAAAAVAAAAPAFREASMALVMRTPPSAGRGGGGGLPASPWGDQEGARAQRWSEPGGVLRDVEAAGRLLSDAVAKEDEASDLADSLDAARLVSQPYATQRPEVRPEAHGLHVGLGAVAARSLAAACCVEPPATDIGAHGDGACWKQWLPQVEVCERLDLPPALIEAYSQSGGDGAALCGLFPEIRRAWATVDNRLFLWRFDKWDGSFMEYSGEDQAICAVGLACPKRGVFIEAIEHLLVLATPVEAVRPACPGSGVFAGSRTRKVAHDMRSKADVAWRQVVLLGVCCSGVGDGFEDLAVQPLPEYAVASDGVAMACIAATASGQIFLGGRDGHLYELLYSSGSGWHRRCQLVCRTSSFGSLLSRWVVPSALQFGTADAIVELALDEERSLLHARTLASKVMVFDLGTSTSAAAPRKVAEEGRAAAAALRASGGGAAARGPPLVHMDVVAPSESRSLHLVAVAADGRRVYLTTAGLGGSQGQGQGGGSTGARQWTCRVVATRGPPPAPSALPGGRPEARQDPAAAGQGSTVEAALSSGNLLLLGVSDEQLLVAARDWTRPPAAMLDSGGGGPPLFATRVLREVVSTVDVGGRALALAEALPPPGLALALDPAAPPPDSPAEATARTRRLLSRPPLATQHAMPRRRFVVLSTTGVYHLAVNRPVDVLRRLLEDPTVSWAALDGFFQQFGRGEAAAMCLLLSARLVGGAGSGSDDLPLPMAVAERAAALFDDRRLVGEARMERASGQGGSAGGGAGSSGFDMGRLDAEPIFGSAHEGLCLCAARILRPLWELPIVTTAEGPPTSAAAGEAAPPPPLPAVLGCRMLVDAMAAVQAKVRPLEHFLRARRDQQRSRLRHLLLPQASHNEDGGLWGSPSTPQQQGAPGSGALPKRQRLEFSQADLGAMEARSMECVRRLLRRAGEALQLLALLSQHHLARLAAQLDAHDRRQLAALSFRQLVCSPEGDAVASKLIAALMQYYVGEGEGLEEMIEQLREGCPSYFNDADRTFFRATELLQRASTAAAADPAEARQLAGQALRLLESVPESADLLLLCPRFEDLRYYQAIVSLPLRKARAVDPSDDALNPHVEESLREAATSARLQCYDVVISTLRRLRGRAPASGPPSTSGRPQFLSRSQEGVPAPLSEEARLAAARQIVAQGAAWMDSLWRRHLYTAMVEDLGMEAELLELSPSPPDLEQFLRSAGSYGAATSSPPSQEATKYLELLSQYYAAKRQHTHAAHVLLRLAERRQPLAVLQAKSQQRGLGVGGAAGAMDASSLLELLEDKLAVLQFQIHIRDDLARHGLAMTGFLYDWKALSGYWLKVVKASRQRVMLCHMRLDASRMEGEEGVELDAAVQELSEEVKSVTQLYNDYAVPFKRWEVCLEILAFSSYSMEGVEPGNELETGPVGDTWCKLVAQALDSGGLIEACHQVRSVGSSLYPGVPLGLLALLLETAAQEDAVSGSQQEEAVPNGSSVASCLISVCRGAAEPVHLAYDRLLGQDWSPAMRLRLLQSALEVLQEWSLSLQALPGPGGVDSLTLLNVVHPVKAASFGEFNGEVRGLRGVISGACNRYLVEIMRLDISQIQKDSLARAFQGLEDDLTKMFRSLPRNVGQPRSWKISLALDVQKSLTCSARNAGRPSLAGSEKKVARIPPALVPVPVLHSVKGKTCLCHGDMAEAERSTST
eukprot:SM000219S06702  [mRNA]  locus=s219:133506:144913:- [translate_table: standard]